MNKTELDLIKKHEKELWYVRNISRVWRSYKKGARKKFSEKRDWCYEYGCYEETCDAETALNSYTETLDESYKNLKYYRSVQKHGVEIDMKIYQTAIENAHKALVETIRESVNPNLVNPDCFNTRRMLVDCDLPMVSQDESFGLADAVFEPLGIQKGERGWLQAENKEVQEKYFDEFGDCLNLEGYLACMFKKMELDFQEYAEWSNEDAEEVLNLERHECEDWIQEAEYKIPRIKENIEREKSVRDYFEATLNEQELTPATDSAPEMTK